MAIHVVVIIAAAVAVAIVVAVVVGRVIEYVRMLGPRNNARQTHVKCQDRCLRNEGAQASKGLLNECGRNSGETLSKFKFETYGLS